MKGRGWISAILFGAFAGIWSILSEHQGITRHALAALAGVCLMVSLRLAFAEVRERKPGG